ncbi:Flp family type IVb pilin [Selenomonas ruminantium]|uniref:Flp/Fap pilin component n=1 Tax=Selenomonas ruminantium TaxID=971 RepID=A0A1K1QK33_SELRU|nr:pilin protein [Selenomonas ruminantium]MBO6202393.1 pilin protein [Selenomonas sp.]SFW60133.1 Flp/Fap pilin component [Selenomonas ruminantium]
MKEIIEYLKARYLNEKAQGMVEYALIVAFIVGVAAVVFASNGSFSEAVNAGFNKVKEKVDAIG